MRIILEATGIILASTESNWDHTGGHWHHTGSDWDRLELDSGERRPWATPQFGKDPGNGLIWEHSRGKFPKRRRWTPWAQLPLPAGLGAGTFPAKLWSLVNDPRVRSLRWDSEARGLLVDRSLFERELLRPGGAQGPAPHAFRATQFRSFVRQLYRYGYGFRKPHTGTSAPHAPAGSAGCAASTASSSAQNAPAQEESPALDLGQEIEKMIREIRNSLPVKAPSAQGNINVAPESPGEDPMNRAAAEEVSSGTESCRNSSPEPEEPGQSIAWVFPPNAHTLQKQFQLTATEAHEIVESCDDCHALGAPLLAGVNPRGLKALELWQTDVTQVTEFGRLKYVHVTVDTFSSAMWASAHTGEKARDVIAHWRQAFAVLGIPSAVKTDSGPAYASQQALDSEQQPRAKVRVRNLVTKQWEEPYDLIAMGRGHACVSTDTGTCWLPSKCIHPDLRPQRQNSADRQGGSRDQLESHQVDESSSVHSDDSSTDSD
ncbi:hypothetical protein DUI87_13778 [Hirundo rustica rustica]|uniref:RNA-directed DNA polymerase n=1 Tax=Hirundo rustica rustica TaxID=333673 RepID=A0A3M0KE24_HIRRU|nr:hypothetical protein DUI87_13778 [Hirundo rustica rustica]